MIDTLTISDSWRARYNEGLVYGKTHTRDNVIISIISTDQEFTKHYLCTNCSKGPATADKISNDMMDGLKVLVDTDSTACIVIKVKYIEKMEFQIRYGCANQVDSQISLSLS